MTPRSQAGSIALLAGALTGAACDGGMSVEGSIQGRDGRAIAGALVALQYGSRVRFEEADAGGSFRVSILNEPLGQSVVRMTVSAPGYAPVVTQLPERASYRCLVFLGEKALRSSEAPVRWDRICVRAESSPRVPDTKR